MAWRLWLGIGLGLGTDAQIVRAGDSLTIRGRIPRSKLPALKEFVHRDLGDVAPFAVAMTFGPGRTIRFRWAGPLDDWTKQRIRNVLVELLK